MSEIQAQTIRERLKAKQAAAKKAGEELFRTKEQEVKKQEVVTTNPEVKRDREALTAAFKEFQKSGHNLSVFEGRATQDEIAVTKPEGTPDLTTDAPIARAA